MVGTKTRRVLMQQQCLCCLCDMHCNCPSAEVPAVILWHSMKFFIGRGAYMMHCKCPSVKVPVVILWRSMKLFIFRGACMPGVVTVQQQKCLWDMPCNSQGVDLV